MPLWVNCFHNVAVTDFCSHFYRANGARWWLRGTLSSSLANSIISLIQDMTAVSSVCVCGCICVHVEERGEVEMKGRAGSVCFAHGGPHKFMEVHSRLSLTRWLQGKLSETWAHITKAAIAEAILNLTKLDESQRHPQACTQLPTVRS